MLSFLGILNRQFHSGYSVGIFCRQLFTKMPARGFLIHILDSFNILRANSSVKHKIVTFADFC